MIKLRVALALMLPPPPLAACLAIDPREPSLRSGPEVGDVANYAIALPAARLLPRAMPVT
jgi:hypothetical protein